MVVTTGNITGRSPYDKYVVCDTNPQSIWWCKTTKKMSASQYAQIRGRIVRHLEKEECYIQHLSVGQNPNHSHSLMVVTETAWHSLFSKQLFINQKSTNPSEYLLLHAPTCFADPESDQTSSSVFIIINLDRKEILIGGTSYAGEIKKSVFTLMNYIMPWENVLPMHCSANVGVNNDTAVFFGLSGTGKTTLSSDPSRALIGDDEHGWFRDGIFNFEGGCYAKTIKLSPKYEPEIWKAADSKGTVLENVVLDSVTGKVDYDDVSITENTRAGYPLSLIPKVYPKVTANHPKNIFFLSADAFGVLPPLSRLTKEQTMYYFLAGYTAKVAGTETGVTQQPQPTFSACFGAPFLPCPPSLYVDMLAERIEEHHTDVWLVNTGWFGGSYGVGERYPLPITRQIIQSVLTGKLKSTHYHKDKIFQLEIPVQIPGIPAELIDPIKNWKNSDLYRSTAETLLAAFVSNLEQYQEDPS